MLLPKKVGSFTLMRTLGADGLTESYVGILDDPAGKQMVARRVLPHVARDAQRLGELRVRVRDLQACRHPALMSLLDFVEVDGEHYILEDWVDAVSLRALLDHHVNRGVGLMHNVYLNLATQICNGLEALHGRPGTESGAANVLHMGLTPESILLTRDGKVLVGAYGLVRSPTALSHTGTNSIGASMEYLAPEQTHQDQPLSPASDIFALGTVLYELLTLRPMFRADSPLQTIHRIRRAEVTTQLLEVKEILPGLDKVLYRALSLNPRHRYQRAFVLREDLRGLMAGYTFSDIEAVTRDELAPVFQARRERETDELMPRIGGDAPPETTASLLGGVEPNIFDSEHDTERDRSPEARWDNDRDRDDHAVEVETVDDDMSPVDLPSDLQTDDAPRSDETSWVVRPDADQTVDTPRPSDEALRSESPSTIELPLESEELELEAPRPQPLGAQDPPSRDLWEDVPQREDTAALLRDAPPPTQESASPTRSFVEGAETAELQSPSESETVEQARQVHEPEPAYEDPQAYEEPEPPLAPPPEVVLVPTPRVSSVPRGRAEHAPEHTDRGEPNWLLIGGAGTAAAFVALALACLGIGGLGMLTSTGTTTTPPVAVGERPDAPPGVAVASAKEAPSPEVVPAPEAVGAIPDPAPADPQPRRAEPSPVPQVAAPQPPAPRVPTPAPPMPEPTRVVEPTPVPVPAPVAVAPVPQPPPPEVFEPLPPPPPQETFDAVAMVDEGTPAETPLGPLSAAELAASSDAAFAGRLDSGVAEKLMAVPVDDAGYTRARTLLFLDAKARGNGSERDEHLAALMSRPENRYNPALLVEEAQIAMGREDWRTALDRAELAERHWARLPSDLIFSRKAMMFEIQALAHTGMYYDSDGDDIDALNSAIRDWEKYRRHVDTKGKADMQARADQHLDRLYEIQRRVE